MLGKVIIGAYKWYSNRIQKKIMDAKMTDQQKKQAEFRKHIQELYSFVQWLNRQFRNRHERKAFWRNISAGQDTIESTMQNLIEMYAPPKKEEKNKKAERGEKPETSKPREVLDINPMANPVE